MCLGSRRTYLVCHLLLQSLDSKVCNVEAMYKMLSLESFDGWIRLSCPALMDSRSDSGTGSHRLPYQHKSMPQYADPDQRLECCPFPTYYLIPQFRPFTVTNISLSHAPLFLPSPLSLIPFHRRRRNTVNVVLSGWLEQKDMVDQNWVAYSF